MGYRDDFYTKDNILGYTGNLFDDPTVYFADAGGHSPRTVMVKGVRQVLVKFGHITQRHDLAKNVGREPVRECFSYTICNFMSMGKVQAKESVYGRPEADKVGLGGREAKDGHVEFHTSRNHFVPVNAGNRDILALAITQHQKLKRMYGGG